MKTIKKMIYNEKYHDNCHDYLKKLYLEVYANPKYKSFLYEIKDKIPKLNICTDIDNLMYSEVIVCDQHGVIFSHHKDIFPILATYALNACVGLIIYEPKYKVASISHFDGLPAYSKESAINDNIDIDYDPVQTNITTIINILRGIVEVSPNEILNFEYYLVGGIFELSEVMIYDIIKCINTLSNSHNVFVFKGRNILGPENQTRNICINTNDGSITHFDYVSNAEFYADDNQGSDLPLNIIKSPRKSEALLDINYRPKLQYLN